MTVRAKVCVVLIACAALAGCRESTQGATATLRNHHDVEAPGGAGGTGDTDGSASSEGTSPVAGAAGDGDGDVQVIVSGGTGASEVPGDGDGNGEADAQAGSGGPNAPAITPGGNCDTAEAFEPLVARDGETCYELHAHDGAGTGGPFIVATDESLNQFFYDIPWPAGSVATRFGSDFDNLAVLNQWLLFSTDSGSHGLVQTSVTGTVLDEHAQVLAAWNVGGCNITLPSDMGLALPDPGSGKELMVQWHHANFTGEPQPDASTVQVCVVPSSTRPNIGGLTLLGTEQLSESNGMPPDLESKYSGTCLNETSEPITIVAFRPTMHLIGTNMYSEVARAGGGIEPVFDQPFVFDNQVHYMSDPTVVLQPGDKIRSECTYFNNTSTTVVFGPATQQEVCFQYVFSYPAGALDKPGNLSLLGATNTCWGDD